MSEALDPKLLVTKATEAYEMGDLEEAVRQYAEAAAAFLSAGNALDAAEMQNNQSVCLLQLGRAQPALDVVLGTADVFSAAGDTRRYGLALGNEAAALEALKRQSEAIEKYTQSGQVLSDAGEDQLRSMVQTALANLYFRRGKFIDGVLAMGSGLAGLKNPTMRQRVLRSLYSLLTTLLRARS